MSSIDPNLTCLATTRFWLGLVFFQIRFDLIRCEKETQPLWRAKGTQLLRRESHKHLFWRETSTQLLWCEKDAQLLIGLLTTGEETRVPIVDEKEELRQK